MLLVRLQNLAAGVNERELFYCLTVESPDAVAHTGIEFIECLMTVRATPLWAQPAFSIGSIGSLRLPRIVRAHQRCTLFREL